MIEKLEDQNRPLKRFLSIYSVFEEVWSFQKHLYVHGIRAYVFEICNSQAGYQIVNMDFNYQDIIGSVALQKILNFKKCSLRTFLSIGKSCLPLNVLMFQRNLRTVTMVFGCFIRCVQLLLVVYL